MNKNNIKNVILIPMAGESSRFFNAGYNVPKYMLNINNNTLFDLTVQSFDFCFNNNNYEFVFLIRDFYNTSSFVKESCKKLNINNYKIIIINDITKGQAETCFIGLNYLIKNNIFKKNDRLFIFNIDTIRLNLYNDLINYLDFTDIDLLFDAVEIYNSDQNKWSYCLVDDNDFVKYTAEKEKISDFCSTGLYIFKNINLYLISYIYNINENKKFKYYVSELYNFLLNKYICKLIRCKKENVHFIGTPIDYVNFLK